MIEIERTFKKMKSIDSVYIGIWSPSY